MNKPIIVIATIKTWNYNNLNLFIEKYKDIYEIFFCKNQIDLNLDFLDKINPQYIFFPHWSFIIPGAIYNKYNCIVFHMTDLPYGRGGSPLQNLILKGHVKTKITAIKVQKEIDSGDIYLKKEVYINKGSAEQIYKKISKIIFFNFIPYIIENNPKPYKQKGEISHFKRRTQEESNIFESNIKNINDFYDFIRMLDAEGYPNAFINYKNFKISFSKVKLKNSILEGSFKIHYEK